MGPSPVKFFSVYRQPSLRSGNHLWRANIGATPFSFGPIANLVAKNLNLIPEQYKASNIYQIHSIERWRGGMEPSDV